jgi:hypothetical protein
VFVCVCVRAPACACARACVEFARAANRAFDFPLEGDLSLANYSGANSEIDSGTPSQVSSRLCSRDLCSQLVKYAKGQICEISKICTLGNTF